MFKNYSQIFKCLTLEGSSYSVCFSLLGFESLKRELWIFILIFYMLYTLQSELFWVAI